MIAILYLDNTCSCFDKYIHVCVSYDDPRLPPMNQIFEKIQQDELRDEMERNSDLAGFMADQVS